MAIENYEKLGVFYLGRPYDLHAKKAKDGYLLYDSKDLVTHAVVVGMTGSGKTGLCLSLLEEAAIDGIPAIVIDPKGDLPNLLLTFPNLAPEDFAPWVNADDARQKGVSIEEHTAQQAELWRNGLQQWEQSGERIGRLRAAADFAVYTPGSNAGIPVSILSSFAAPPQNILDDDEALRERVSSTATSLLGLLGIAADPLKSREHILLTNILHRAWTNGEDLDLGALIGQIQKPSFTRVGIMDIESFYPAKERFELAMSLNNLLASPSFAAWMEGEALDIQRMLYTPAGKPRVAIFSIAHLNDTERMFFVSLLLNQTLGWMRAQSGTTSLRALLYMDEIFGYFPPTANPPSKQPLLTLLKQARAFGLGVVLATQNPVDLDYKGLSNAGTWFIGRLQTERDKARVLEGLEGAATGAGQGFDRNAMERLIAGLGSRVFLLNNVHDDAPVVFQTRWTMSYLRGPLTRQQIKLLMAERKAAQAAAPTSSAAPPARSASAAAAAAETARPVIPPEVRQYFIPLRSSAEGATLLYQPMALGAVAYRCTDAKKGVDAAEVLSLLAPITEAAIPVDWEQAWQVEIDISGLEHEPADGAQFDALPPIAAKAKSYDKWGKDLSNWVYRAKQVTLWRSPSLGEISRVGEAEGDFRTRLRQAHREERDAAVEQLKQKYAPKLRVLEDRTRRAEQALQKEQEQASQAKLSTVFDIGATILSSVFGRKAISVGNIGRVASTARRAGRVMKEGKDVSLAEENIDALQQQMADLDAQFQAEAAALEVADAAGEALETVAVRPTKTNINVRLTALAWVPYWRDEHGQLAPAWE